jgi:hypothetical protein
MYLITRMQVGSDCSQCMRLRSSLAHSTCMQTIKGGKEVPSRAPAGAEIQAFIEETADKLKAHPLIPANFRPYFLPLWSLDNAPVHKAAISMAWPNKPAGLFNSVSPPPYSPDLHKVIEHVHARVCTEFMDWIVKHPNIVYNTIEEYFARLENIFYSVITAEIVKKDVQSLQLTFAKVVEAQGGYPAPKFR